LMRRRLMVARGEVRDTLLTPPSLLGITTTHF
jgi:hypothetical protein